MAFYQGSLEGCNPAPPPAQLPLTQGRFSSRAHFPKCTCFKSKMSDISETNNPRFCFFIFTESHLQDCGSGCNKRCLSALVLIDIVDTVAFCVLTIKLLNVTQLHELDFFLKGYEKCVEMLRYKIGCAEKRNYVQKHPGS